MVKIVNFRLKNISIKIPRGSPKEISRGPTPSPPRAWPPDFDTHIELEVEPVGGPAERPRCGVLLSDDVTSHSVEYLHVDIHHVLPLRVRPVCQRLQGEGRQPTGGTQ